MISGARLQCHSGPGHDYRHRRPETESGRNEVSDLLSRALAASERFKELDAKATKGPWRHYRNKLRPTFGGIINEVQCGERCPIVRWGGFDDSDRAEKKHSHNAAFIAASRTGWPAHDALLLECVEEIKRLQAELDSAREVVRAAEAANKAIAETFNEGTIYRITSGGTKQRLLGLESQDALYSALSAHLAKYPEGKG